MNFLKYSLVITFSITIHIAFAQTDNLAKATAEMEQVYKETYNADLGIKTCKTVLDQVQQYSKTYFEATLYLGDWYIIKRDKSAIKSLLEQLKVDIENNGIKKNKTAWIYYLYLNSRYNSEITYNTEKAVIQGVAAFYMAKSKPKILAKITPQAAIALTGVAQYGTATDIFKVYEVSEKLNRKNELEQCKFLLTSGQVHLKAENWWKANGLLAEALKVITPKAKEYPFLYEKCMIELAKSFAELNKMSTAIELLNRLPKDDSRSYEYWEKMALFLFNNEKIDESLVMSQKAITKMVSNFSSMNIKDNPQKDSDYIDVQKATRNLYIKSMALRQKALDAFEDNDKAKSIELFRKSMETAEIGIEVHNQLTDEMTGFGIADLIANEEINVLMGAMIHAAFGLYEVTESKSDFNQLFRLMEQRRGLSILQRTSDSPIPADLLPKFEDYFQRIEQYEIIFSIGEEASFEKLMEVTELTFEYEAFFETLKQRTDKVRLTPADFEYISADELQQSLDEETVFIQYSVARRHIYAISITENSFRAELVHLGDSMIEYNIYPFIDMIKNPFLIQDKHRKDFIHWSNYFYNILIRPFEEDIKGKQRLVVSPERELLFLPYETLLKSTDNKPFHELDFLIESFEINYRYSATLHKKIQERPAIKNYSTLAFAPIFEYNQGTGRKDRAVKMFDSYKYASMDKKKFVHLPNSKQEVEQIKALIGSKGEMTLLLGNEATKDNLREKIKANSYQFIHLATHSMVNFDDPRVSAIACYQIGNSENLYLSNEVNIENIRADLVVLSSCESGIGRIIEGEGIIGLNRSFIAAGARNVLFSLWKVDDKGSSQLMIDFYDAYMKTEDYTTSLRQAKLKMLNDETMANPRYWAAFVLIGE